MSESHNDEARERKATAAQLGRRLLRLLAPTRVRSLSLHDASGELLWLSHGEFGAIQRRYIQDAQDAFSLEGSAQHLERDVDNGGKALFFCSRTPTGERSGMAFAIVSGRRRPDVDFEALRARVFATMGRFSNAPLSPPAEPTFKVRSSRRTPDAPAAEPTPAESAALRSRAYARLRPGGTTRRYEIAVSGVQSMAEDLSSAGRLVSLIQRRGARDAPTPASFTLPLCAASVLSAQFLEQLAPALKQAALADDMLGFLVPAAAWEQDFAATERFIDQCGQQRCFVALDDFNLSRPGFALLRASALRCLKLDAALTADVLDDRFAHAGVAAIIKAARVLGLYCVAKGVKHTATARWLASAGIEFADRSKRAGTGGATTRNRKALTLVSGH
jgi:EAL domain